MQIQHLSSCRGFAASNVNDTKTEVQTFRYRSLLSERNQNVLMCSKKKKSNVSILVQKLGNEIITFLCVPVWRVALLLYVYTCRSLNSNPRCNMLINPPTG
jgi:hypothetical protein